MALRHMDEYRDAQLSRPLIDRIKKTSTRSIRLMEVCGTHTVSIFRSGIRSVLPETITLLSGPGCPVCVTDQKEIDAFIALSRQPEVIVATFGDLIRVPGSGSSLQKEKAKGQDIRVVYSAMDAVDIARQNPDKRVVFLGVGFETTAPTVAAAIMTAKQTGVTNFLVSSAHKRVPPALIALASLGNINVDGFILPGHVSVIIGLNGYGEFFRRYPIPSVVAGFEPTDILQAIAELVAQIESQAPRLSNTYERVVGAEGNPKARSIMAAVFDTTDAAWRGIGVIARSGLAIRPEYAAHDAMRQFDLQLPPSEELKGCACGAVLTGAVAPPECALFKKVCTPIDPVGPCMVSSEGTCAAYYRFHDLHV